MLGPDLSLSPRVDAQFLQKGAAMIPSSRIICLVKKFSGSLKYEITAVMIESRVNIPNSHRDFQETMRSLYPIFIGRAI